MHICVVLSEQLVTNISTSHIIVVLKEDCLKQFDFLQPKPVHAGLPFTFGIKVHRNIQQVKCCKNLLCFVQMEGLKRVFKVMNTDRFAVIP